MLCRMADLMGGPIHATDGDIGSIQDFYFDDGAWVIRYLVADTRRWLPGRLVLISPASIDRGGVRDSGMSVKLTKTQVENSPGIDSHQTVSRQHEAAVVGYYGWPAYWPPPAEMREVSRTATAEREPQLRSANVVKSHYLHAQDGDLGSIEDFVFDDNTWEIRYMLVNTGSWWPGKRVLVAREWIENIDWYNSTVFVNLTQDEIRRSPEYDPAKPIDRQYEERLYHHYRRPGYWR